MRRTANSAEAKLASVQCPTLAPSAMNRMRRRPRRRPTGWAPSCIRWRGGERGTRLHSSGVEAFVHRFFGWHVARSETLGEGEISGIMDRSRFPGQSSADLCRGLRCPGKQAGRQSICGRGDDEELGSASDGPDAPAPEHREEATGAAHTVRKRKASTTASGMRCWETSAEPLHRAIGLGRGTSAQVDGVMEARV